MAEPQAQVVAAESVAAELVAAETVAIESLPEEMTSPVAVNVAPVGNGNIAAIEPAENTDELNGSKIITDQEKKIIKQVEYYFGDVNLPKDKFLQEQIKVDEGWIPLYIMLKFKRLAALSTNVEVILNAVAKSDAQIIEISNDRKKIRRSAEKPLPILNEDRRKELVTRTIYAKGFPGKGMTLDDFFIIFSKYGTIDNLYMRTLKDKATGEIIFKGSVYVMYAKLESAKAVMDLESFKHNDVELKRMWQADHLELKRKERDLKKEKVKHEAQEVKIKEEPGVDKESGVKKQLGAFAKGCTLHMQGFSGEITREDIKSELAPLGAEVAFVTYNKGDNEAWVRLEKDSAEEVFDKLDDGKIEVCGCELEVRVIKGEEEDKFLEKSKIDLISRRSRGRGGRGHRGGRGKGSFRGRGGRGGYKRKWDRECKREEPEIKKEKF